MKINNSNDEDDGIDTLAMLKQACIVNADKTAEAYNEVNRILAEKVKIPQGLLVSLMTLDTGIIISFPNLDKNQRMQAAIELVFNFYRLGDLTEAIMVNR